MTPIRYLLPGLTLCVLHLSTTAQSTSAMLDQIAALKGYIGTAEKGYKIAEDGLHTIGDIKNDEFNLHRVYFGSLSAFNPNVRYMPQIADIRLHPKNAEAQQALDDLLTDGRLQMDDGGRMRRIEALDKAIKPQP
jgi:hypothetical protein